MTADEFETQWRDHSRRFETMNREELLSIARAWCWNALIARDERQRILSGTAHMLTSHEQRLARLWQLADARKKTIPMDAFMKAFGVGSPQQPEGDDAIYRQPADPDPRDADFIGGYQPGLEDA